MLEAREDNERDTAQDLGNALFGEQAPEPQFHPHALDGTEAQTVTASDALWPANVPAMEEAIRLLTNPDIDTDLVEPTRETLRALSPMEMDALFGHPMAFDVRPLQDTVAARWVLRVATHLKPKEDNISFEALAQLINTADRVVAEAYPPRETKDQQTRSVFKQARRELREATEALAALLPVEERKPRPRPVSRTRTITVAVERPRRPRKLLPVVFVLTVLAGLLYHGTRLSERMDTLNLPAGLELAPGFEGAPAPVIQAEHRKRITAEQKNELKLLAESEGKTLLELPRNQGVVLLPKQLPVGGADR